MQRGTEIGVCVGPSGVKTDCSPVALGGFSQLALLRQGVTEIIVGLRPPRLENGRLAVMPDRLFDPALAINSIGKVIVGLGIGGPQSDCIAKMLLRLRKFPLIL